MRTSIICAAIIIAMAINESQKLPEDMAFMVIMSLVIFGLWDLGEMEIKKREKR